MVSIHALVYLQSIDSITHFLYVTHFRIFVCCSEIENKNDTDKFNINYSSTQNNFQHHTTPYLHSFLNI